MDSWKAMRGRDHNGRSLDRQAGRSVCRYIDTILRSIAVSASSNCQTVFLIKYWREKRGIGERRGEDWIGLDWIRYEFEFEFERSPYNTSASQPKAV